MGVYNFIPFLDGKNRFDLSINCVPCKNINEACDKASHIKSNLNCDFVTIVKHITQI